MINKMQESAFQIIAVVGTAKSCYIEAMQISRTGNFDEARAKIKEGDGFYAEAHKFHFELIQMESNGEQLPFSILFMHAEDQLLNTETIKIMAEEIIMLREEKND
ncbi:MAG: PTS lactose/cellobiose transporter subunit IIA [Spiroplasma sp.]|nr:PTS lactose/cellobiose transporter subunit IIA [Mycoplasmatales bacterium]